MEREQPMNPPRILLVEDDPVSQAFLASVVEALPAVVDRAGTLAAAIRLASEQVHDAWLIDAHLPDGRGSDLLARLRMDHETTPALAHTASPDRRELDALVDAGFLEVLVKPLSAAMLQAAVQRALGRRVAECAAPARCGKLPLWDDAAALSALNGQHAHVAALRTLFVAELPGQRQAIAAAFASGDVTALRATLHRLRASCGFVGAARLDSAVRALDADPRCALAMQRFDDTTADVLASA